MKKTKKGFTLVELVIVVAVMAVLVAVAIPTVSAITKSAEDSVNKTNAQTIESMLKLYEAETEVFDADGKSVAISWLTVPTGESDSHIVIALKKAELGIEKGTFYYNSELGTCGVDAPSTGSDTIIKIEYTNGIPAASSTKTS